MSTRSSRSSTRESSLKPSTENSAGRARYSEPDPSYRSTNIIKSRVRFDLPQEALEDPFNDSSRRWANVYDACASRVNSRGFNPEEPTVASTRDTKSSGLRHLKPEDVIYRRLAQRRGKEEMKQFIDDETYFAHEKLPANRPLPRADLLECIHAYAADFYQHQSKKRGKLDQHSMDESALLAIGILVEELSREQVGATGDMALVEGESSSADEGETSDNTFPAVARRKKRARAMTVDGPISQHHQYLQGVRQKQKRRRTKRSEAEASGHDTNTARMDDDFGEG